MNRNAAAAMLVASDVLARSDRYMAQLDISRAGEPAENADLRTMRRFG